MNHRGRVWHIFDAKNEVLGRLSAKIASTLIGKHKAGYEPSEDIGDYCVVINAKDIEVTGRKEEQKVYHRHTQWPGGLISTPYKDMEKIRIIEIAVRGMIPRNMLREQRYKRLRVFSDDKHPYSGNIMKIDFDFIESENLKNINLVKSLLQ